MPALDLILRNTIQTAMRAPGNQVRRNLPSGLTISVRVDNMVLTIDIFREDTYPSETEWFVILDHLPWMVAHKPPTHGYNYHLTGVFAIPANINRFNMQLRML